MAIFKKKNAAEIFTDTPVMSGGNSKAIFEQQQAQIAIDKATIAHKSFYKSIDNSVKNFVEQEFANENYDDWRLINFQADYFCNLFTVDAEGQTTTWAIQTAQRVSFIYGVSVIYYDRGRLIPCYVYKSEIGETGEYVKLLLAPASTILPQQSQIPKKVKITYTLTEGEIKDKCAILKWDTLALGAWYKFLPYIKQLSRMNKMLSAESWNLIKKAEWRVNSADAFLKEIAIFYNPNLPFTVTGKSSADFSNKINMLETTNKDATTFTNFYNDWNDIWYKLLGRRNNADFKKERNVTNEIDASQSNFDILETDHFLHFKVFIKRLEEITGLKFNIRSVYDNDEKEVKNDI